LIDVCKIRELWSFDKKYELELEDRFTQMFLHDDLVIGVAKKEL
jgi:hypothetical protein